MNDGLSSKTNDYFLPENETYNLLTLHPFRKKTYSGNKSACLSVELSEGAYAGSYRLIIWRRMEANNSGKRMGSPFSRPHSHWHESTIWALWFGLDFERNLLWYIQRSEHGGRFECSSSVQYPEKGNRCKGRRSDLWGVFVAKKCQDQLRYLGVCYLSHDPGISFFYRLLIADGRDANIGYATITQTFHLRVQGRLLHPLVWSCQSRNVRSFRLRSLLWLLSRTHQCLCFIKQYIFLTLAWVEVFVSALMLTWLAT